MYRNNIKPIWAKKIPNKRYNSLNQKNNRNINKINNAPNISNNLTTNNNHQQQNVIIMDIVDVCFFLVKMEFINYLIMIEFKTFENIRINQHEGIKVNNRIYGQLMLSRSFGD